MRLRVAVVGPGAIGGTVAAWLAQDSGLAVTVCARTPFDSLEIEAPSGPVRAAPAILTDPSGAEAVDWVLIATKTYDTAGAAAWLPGLVGPETRVAVLQNGVEHVARFTPFVPAGRITPAVVDIPAERLAPGRIVQRRDGSRSSCPRSRLGGPLSTCSPGCPSPCRLRPTGPPPPGASCA